MLDEEAVKKEFIRRNAELADKAIKSAEKELRIKRKRIEEISRLMQVAYENTLSESGSMADKVKFRYRGYYYDSETGFYYLQSWYYDPSICRFISADQYELVGTLSKSLGELNLYSYCANNPIMYTDENGTLVWSTGLIIVGVVAGLVAGGYIGYTSVVNDPTLSTRQKLAGIGLCAILGGIAGGFFGAGLSCALPGIIGSSAAGHPMRQEW